MRVQTPGETRLGEMVHIVGSETEGSLEHWTKAQKSTVGRLDCRTVAAEERPDGSGSRDRRLPIQTLGADSQSIKQMETRLRSCQQHST